MRAHDFAFALHIQAFAIKIRECHDHSIGSPAGRPSPRVLPGSLNRPPPPPRLALRGFSDFRHGSTFPVARCGATRAGDYRPRLF